MLRLYVGCMTSSLKVGYCITKPSRTNRTFKIVFRVQVQRSLESQWIVVCVHCALEARIGIARFLRSRSLWFLMKLVSRDAEPRNRQRGSTDPVRLWCKCNINWLVPGTEYWKWVGVRITGQALACRSISTLFYAVCIAGCFVMKADMKYLQVMVPYVTSSSCSS